MTNATLDLGTEVSLAQAAKLIVSCPNIRVMLEGEMGIGKTALRDTIAEMVPHAICPPPIDAPNMNLGDDAMPVVDREQMVTRYAPNSRFRIQEAIRENRPVLLMIDELSKASAPVRNALHSLFENRPRLGDLYLPEGSMICATGNTSAEGLGDTLQAHTLNRMTRLKIRKPTAEEWLAWARGKIHPALCAWVDQNPECMASYKDEGQADNPYINNPRKVMAGAFVTGRSLERASHVLWGRDQIFADDSQLLIASLAGTVGESAARGIEAFIQYSDQLPSWEAIISDPKRTQVPVDPGACAVLVYGAPFKVTKDTMTPFMEYVQRLDPQWQAVFCISMAKDRVKQSIAFGCKAFANWVSKNEDIL